MSISNDALQKLVQEIEAKAIQAQREINAVKSTVVTRQRDNRLMELTSVEMKSLPAETKLYEGVGRMFVETPKADVERRLETETSELKSDITNLNKKLHYLETTHKNSKNHIEQILRSGARR